MGQQEYATCVTRQTYRLMGQHDCLTLHDMMATCQSVRILQGLLQEEKIQEKVKLVVITANLKGKA